MVRPPICGLQTRVKVDESDPRCRWFPEEEMYIPVPLTQVNVNVQLVNFTAQVTVEQTYVNKEENAIECIYFFPVEESAAVISFHAKLDGREIISKIKKKEEAKKDYDEAVKSGKTAMMLESVGDRPDIFQMSVGHLSPGSKVDIALTYIAEAELAETGDDRCVRLTLPTTIAPKYIPSGHSDSPAAQKISSIKYDMKSPAPLKLNLTAKMSSQVTQISSPSHKLEVKEAKQDDDLWSREASFLSKTSDLDRDIVVLVETSESRMSQAVAEQASESVALQLSMVPRFAIKSQTKGTEIVFVIDCSGSMMGESIKMAKEALQLFLHSLPVDVVFNIVRFGSQFEMLFAEGARPYDDDTLTMAKNLAQNMDADLGGTEIYRPLDIIFRSKKRFDNPMPRQVIVITDGEVSNSTACIDLVKKNAKENRVFTLGIGSAADRHLVKGMARAGQGTAAFTTQGENMAPKVLKQLKCAMQPVVMDAIIKWIDIEDQEIERPPEIAQAPREIPPVYDGTRLQIFNLIPEGGSKIPAKLEISAKMANGSTFSEVVIVKIIKTVETDSAGMMIHKMFARKMIQDLEENLDSQLQSEKDEEERKSSKEELKSLVTDISLQYQVISSHTAFIAVDPKEADKATSGVMVTRQVHNQVPSGFGFGMRSGSPGVWRAQVGHAPQQVMMSMAAPMSFGASNCLPFSMKGGGVMTKCAPPKKSLSRKGTRTESDAFVVEECMDVDMANEEDDEGYTDSSTPLSNMDKVLLLSSLQSASGYFKASTSEGKSLENIVARVIGLNSSSAVNDLKEKLKETEVADFMEKKCSQEASWWGTALIVAILKTKFPSERDCWEMIVDKALVWLSGTGEEDQVTGVITAIQKII